MLLAFETSAKAASVALFDGDKLLGESYQNTGLTHSQTLLVMAQESFSWQNSISLCPASFCTPKPNLPVTPDIS